MKHLNFLLIAFTALTLSSCNDKYPDLKDGIYAEFVTSMGTTVAELKYEDTPLTVANFVALAEGTQEAVDSIYKGKRFYDGLIFHRVIKDFMIQGGDPKGDGSGNPGYKFADEIVDSLSHSKKGILSMANSGPSTNGSQFFITLKETPWLNGRHTVFGEIVLGQEVVDSIGVVETTKPGDKPKDTLFLQKVNIYRKGSSAKAFDAPAIFKAETEKLEAEKAEKEAAAIAAAEKTKAKFEALKPNAETKESGLKMVMNEKGTGEQLKNTDQVGVYYAGYLADGTLFDTNILETAKETGTFNQRRADGGGYSPMPVPYNNEARMIPGFKEGILAMSNIGDKATFFIPAALGYGERGGGPIPPNADLIFEVEFKEIAVAPKQGQAPQK